MTMPPANRSRTGPLTILAMFVLGGLFLLGLYLAKWWGTSPQYANSIVGVPDRAMRVASMNLDWTIPPETAATALKPVNADIVLLQRVSRKDAQSIAQLLAMRHEGQLQMVYSPDNPGDSSMSGNAILSRFQLEKGRSIPKAGARSFGVFAEPIIDGKRFLVASVDMNYSTDPDADRNATSAALEKQNFPPVVMGGIFATGAAIRAIGQAWRGGDTQHAAGNIIYLDLAETASTSRPATVPAVP